MTITTFTVVVGRCATPCSSAGGHCRHARRLWPPLEQPGHARAAAETAGCRFGRRRSRRRARPQLRRGGRADCQAANQRGKFALGGSVGLSVGLSGLVWSGIDLLSWSALPRLVCACRWPVPETGFWVLRRLFAKVGPQRCLCVFMSTARPSSRLSIARSAPSFILAPVHAVEVNRRCLVGAWAWDFARAAATRSALCAVLVVFLRCVGCFSCLNGTDRSFCGLRQRARQRRPPATSASDARQRRPPAGHTKPRDSTRNQRAMSDVAPACPL